MYDPDLAINEQYEEIEQLKDTLQDETLLREKLAGLLERTANALKGPPAYLYSHDWSDLPKVATQLKAKNEALRKGITTMRNMYTSVRWEYQRLDALLKEKDDD